MRQRIFLFGSILLLFFSATCFGFVRDLATPSGSETAETKRADIQAVFTEEEVFPSETEEVQAVSYRVQNHNGHIGLFLCTEGAPPKLIDELHTSVSTLREEDQRLINAGIELHTLEEAERIMENFEN